MRKKMLVGLRAAQIILAAKAAVGGFAAALALFGVSASFLGFEPTIATEGAVSTFGAVVAVTLALRGA